MRTQPGPPVAIPMGKGVARFVGIFMDDSLSRFFVFFLLEIIMIQSYELYSYGSTHTYGKITVRCSSPGHTTAPSVSPSLAQSRGPELPQTVCYGLSPPGQLPSAIGGSIARGPCAGPLRNVPSRVKEKAQQNICPPQGSSAFSQDLKHIDWFKVAKRLEKDIPFLA